MGWNSINSFFNTSFGSSNSMFGNFYSNLSDASMIKSGTYKKLMRSYFNDVKPTSSDKGSSTTASSSSSSSSSKKSKHACTYTYDSKSNTISTVRNKVLDDLLDKKPKKSTITNPVLDDLLKKDKKATEDGTVTDKTNTDAATTDTTTGSSTTVSEATAGAVIDESV